MTRTISYALVAIGVALSTPVVAAAPADATIGCHQRGVHRLFGRTVKMWMCAVRWHGQIVNASAGDSVEMRYVRHVLRPWIYDWITSGKTYVPPGSNTANSGEIPAQLFNPFPKACIQVADHPGFTACT
jgi:hypothetical protein